MRCDACTSLLGSLERTCGCSGHCKALAALAQVWDGDRAAVGGAGLALIALAHENWGPPNVARLRRLGDFLLWLQDADQERGKSRKHHGA